MKLNGSNPDTSFTRISLDDSLDSTICVLILSPVSVIPSEIFSLTFSTNLSPVSVIPSEIFSLTFSTNLSPVYVIP